MQKGIVFKSYIKNGQIYSFMHYGSEIILWTFQLEHKSSQNDVKRCRATILNIAVMRDQRDTTKSGVNLKSRRSGG
jgi:hypothetical protein